MAFSDSTFCSAATYRRRDKAECTQTFHYTTPSI